MNSKRKLTEYKRAVLTTITMRLTRKEAVAYLKAEGYPISNATLGRIKSELQRNSLKRMHKVAAYEFHQQHLNRIDTCELICQIDVARISKRKVTLSESSDPERKLRNCSHTYHHTTKLQKWC